MTPIAFLENIMSRPTLCLLLLTAFCCLCAAEKDPRLQAFQQALQTSDYTQKKQAAQALMGVADDDAVYAALVKAAQDRQLKRVGLRLLRQRSGLQPATGDNPGYPGFPSKDTPSGWQTWNQARLEEKRQKAELAAAKQAAEEAKATAEKATEIAEHGPDEGESADTEESATAAIDPEEAAQQPAGGEPEGSIDRIIFTDGSILMGSIIAKRIDLDGDLTSLTIRHLQGGGEEDIEAHLIARIEEDVR